jgi:L-asparaginase II
MLLTCQANGWPLDTYLDPDHPLQRHLKATIEDLAEEQVTHTGVDGCGAPLWAFSLRGLARAFNTLANATGGREKEVADAMRQHPEMVSGTGPLAYDTILMKQTPGLIAKVGAEGVQAVGIPGVGAIAIKIEDGAKRALMPVLGWAFKQLGLDIETPKELVMGGGKPVGEVRVAL